MLRESKIVEQMELLGIKDITTIRQTRNGTVIWQLPIKMYGQYVEVGSFKSGYVRRMNGGYTPYQLNKCENYDHYYKDYRWNDDYSEQTYTGKYNKMVCRRRIKIDKEIDRLEYLISYCLKNYYIKQANQVEDGKFVPKWKHEYEMKNGDIERVRELQSENRRLHNIYLKQTTEIQDLKYELKIESARIEDVSVTINGERYKII
jgi:hypothetical protein